MCVHFASKRKASIRLSVSITLVKLIHRSYGKGVILGDQKLNQSVAAETPGKVF